MSVRVKICGITRLEDALAAYEAGADALGFVFYPKSPRCVSVETAREIAEALPPFASSVGVFVDAPMEHVRRTAERVGLRAVQLHGNEPPAYCAELGVPAVKAFRVRDSVDFPFEAYRGCAAFLLDAYVKGEPGGTGRSFRWELAREACRRRRVILAGGLTPENVERAIQTVQPHAVDVSSGVEVSPGVKDHEKTAAFIRTAKAACNV